MHITGVAFDHNRSSMTYHTETARCAGLPEGRKRKVAASHVRTSGRGNIKSCRPPCRDRERLRSIGSGQIRVTTRATCIGSDTQAYAIARRKLYAYYAPLRNGRFLTKA